MFAVEALFILCNIASILACATFPLCSCSWRPCWVRPSLRWTLTTVPTQTAVSLEAAATRFPSARPQWLSAPVTSPWFHCQLHQRHDVAAGVERPSTWLALHTPPTHALMGAPARMDHWDTGKRTWDTDKVFHSIQFLQRNVHFHKNNVLMV